jgi:hypothetical protein
MGIEKSKGRRKREQQRLRSQEAAWAKRSGPVVIITTPSEGESGERSEQTTDSLGQS